MNHVLTDDPSQRIFISIIKDFSISPNSPSTLLSVTKSGQIFLYSLKGRYAGYSLNTPEKPQMEKIAFAESFSNILDHDIESFDASTVIHCLTTLSLVKSIENVKIDLYPTKLLLIVSGVLIQSIETIAVYRISSSSLDLIYHEPLLGVAGIVYAPCLNLLAALPRSFGGEIALFDPPSRVEEFSPRLVPSLRFLGNPSNRTSQICAGNALYWNALTWSDDFQPHFTLWRFDSVNLSSLYETITVEFQDSMIIGGFSVHPQLNKVGFIAEVGQDVLSCVWDIGVDAVRQSNYVLPESGPISTTKWSQDELGRECFCSFGQKATYEQSDNSMIAYEIGSIRSGLYDSFEDGVHVHFTEKGEYVTSRPKASFAGGKELGGLKKGASLPFVRLNSSGVSYEIRGLHLYRCANCSKPLLVPLVCESKSPNLHCCYCCQRCQQMHWPLFLSSHQPLFFDGSQRR